MLEQDVGKTPSEATLMDDEIAVMFNLIGQMQVQLERLQASWHVQQGRAVALAEENVTLRGASADVEVARASATDALASAADARAETERLREDNVLLQTLCARLQRERDAAAAAAVNDAQTRMLQIHPRSPQRQNERQDQAQDHNASSQSHAHERQIPELAPSYPHIVQIPVSMPVLPGPPRPTVLIAQDLAPEQRELQNGCPPQRLPRPHGWPELCAQLAGDSALSTSRKPEQVPSDRLAKRARGEQSVPCSGTSSRTPMHSDGTAHDRAKLFNSSSETRRDEAKADDKVGEAEVKGEREQNTDDGTDEEGPAHNGDADLELTEDVERSALLRQQRPRSLVGARCMNASPPSRNAVSQCSRGNSAHSPARMECHSKGPLASRPHRKQKRKISHSYSIRKGEDVVL
jgi:hypothetical protein